jgi:hypothetical protein
MFSTLTPNGFKIDSGISHKVQAEKIGDGEKTVTNRQRFVEYGVGPGVNRFKALFFSVTYSREY